MAQVEAFEIVPPQNDPDSMPPSKPEASGVLASTETATESTPQPEGAVNTPAEDAAKDTGNNICHKCKQPQTFNYDTDNEEWHAAPPLEARGRTKHIPHRPLRRPHRINVYDSLSRSRSRSHSRSPSPIRKLDIVYSHTELFVDNSPSTTGTIDRSVRLEPFGRPAFVTTHPATPVDFRNWIPLLAYAQPDQWYEMPNPQVLLDLICLPPFQASAAAQTVFKPLLRPRVRSVVVPQIAATAALTKGAKSAVSASVDEKGKAKKEEEEEEEENIPLIYLSVQQTTAEQDRQSAEGYNGRYINNDLYDEPVRRRGKYHLTEPPILAGRPVYRVIRTGSREAAASAAFYAAGSPGWSTVFTCTVAMENDALVGMGLVLDSRRYKRVKSLRGLAGGVAEGKIKVFY